MINGRAAKGSGLDGTGGQFGILKASRFHFLSAIQFARKGMGKRDRAAVGARSLEARPESGPK